MIIETPRLVLRPFEDKDSANIASVNLMQRFGMRCEGHFVKSSPTGGAPPATNEKNTLCPYTPTPLHPYTLVFLESLWFKDSWVDELWFAILREEWKVT